MKTLIFIILTTSAFSFADIDIKKFMPSESKEVRFSIDTTYYQHNIKEVRTTVTSIEKKVSETEIIFTETTKREEKVIGHYPLDLRSFQAELIVQKGIDTIYVKSHSKCGIFPPKVTKTTSFSIYTPITLKHWGIRPLKKEERNKSDENTIWFFLIGVITLSIYLGLFVKKEDYFLVRNKKQISLVVAIIYASAIASLFFPGQTIPLIKTLVLLNVGIALIGIIIFGGLINDTTSGPIKFIASCSIFAVILMGIFNDFKITSEAITLSIFLLINYEIFVLFLSLREKIDVRTKLRKEKETDEAYLGFLDLIKDKFPDGKYLKEKRLATAENNECVIFIERKNWFYYYIKDKTKNSELEKKYANYFKDLKGENYYHKLSFDHYSSFIDKINK